MKKLIYSLSAAAVLTFTACKKDFLDTMPTDSYASEQVFTNVDGALSALNGIHRSLYIQYDGQDQGGQGSMMILNDMLGDDLVNTFTGNGWWNASYQWQMHRNTSATLLRFSYRFYYRIIANANMILSHIDAAPGDDDLRNEVKGQAYAYRAWAHFNLVQLFAARYDATTDNSQNGIVLLLDNSIEGKPRSTVAQVYTQINADADSAILLLNGSAGLGNKSHLNGFSANGIKARVALVQQDWGNAARYAAAAKEGYQLMSNAQYLAGFNDYENPEWIWGSHQISEQTTYFYSFFAYMSANFNSTAIRTNPKAINNTLYDRISNTDIRKQLWSVNGRGIPIPPGGVIAPYINQKFLANSSSSSVGDVPNMRAAEMYLIEAEADARLGNDAAAADVLYTLAVNRDVNYVRSTNVGDALIDEIMTQRRVELWGEGFRFFDLKRLNQALDRTGTNHSSTLANGTMQVPAGDIRWQFLIPQDEINANSAISQNPL